jgi:hypothetical protein
MVTVQGTKMAPRFVDFIIPVLSVRSRDRVFQANNMVSMTAARPWLNSQVRGASKFQGAMPRTFSGVIVSPQTMLRGVLPLDYMTTMQGRLTELDLH